MSKYEFSLRQEVLMEVGASVLGDLFRYSEERNIESESDPVTILYGLVWNAKQDILLAKTEAELDQIEGKFRLARNFLSGLETAYAEEPDFSLKPMIYSTEGLKERIVPVARKYGIRAVYLFGSYARGEATEQSDVDILIDRAGSVVRGLMIGALYEDLRACIGKKIDLVTVQTLEQPDTKERCPGFVQNVYADMIRLI